MYVTEDYYLNVYKGEPVDAFDALQLRAAEIVEEMTMYRLTELTYEAMPECVQTAVKKAICAQMEYLDSNGGPDLDNGAALASASLGKFSYTMASEGKPGIYAPRALRLLAPTGLLYRGGICR